MLIVVTALLAVAAIHPLAQTPPARSTAPAAQPTKFDPLVSRTLKNGLEIIVLEDHSVPLVTMDLAVRNGSFTESPELNGLSHLYEHMFFSPNNAPRRIGGNDDALEAGIVYNGSTREEVVEYYYTTTSPNFAVIARLLADAARWPGFDEAALAREREVVIGEMDRRESNPFGALDKALDDRLFFKYPTRKDPLGTRSTVRAATTDLMKRIQGRYYVPNNSAVVIAGDVTPADAFAAVENLFGDWERRAVDPFVEFPLVDHPPLPASSAAILTGPVQTVIIELGWQGPSVGKDDQATYSADVFSFIIRQPNSRFQRALVDSGLMTAVDFGTTRSGTSARSTRRVKRRRTRPRPPSRPCRIRSRTSPIPPTSPTRNCRTRRRCSRPTTCSRAKSPASTCTTSRSGGRRPGSTTSAAT